MQGLDYSLVVAARKRYRVTADEDRKHLGLAERIELKLIQDLTPIANCLESSQRVSE